VTGQYRRGQHPARHVPQITDSIPPGASQVARSAIFRRRPGWATPVVDGTRARVHAHACWPAAHAKLNQMIFGNRSIWLAEAPRPEAVRRHPRAPWFAVGVVCFGAFMGQLDASIVTVTFGPMEREFHAPLAAVQWVSLGYLLALVALLAPAGRISDARGRKLVYTGGFVVFTLASAACGLAPTLPVLVAVRLVQAVGAAMLQANSVALVATSVPRSSARLALGVQAAAQSIGLALGPAAGGLLTAAAGWRAVYLVNVPVGCLAIVAARQLLPRSRQLSPAGRFDWPGTALLAMATTGALLALSAAGGLGVPAGVAIALGVGSLLAVAGFAGRENRAANPVLPLSLLRQPGLVLALCGAVCGYLMLFGPLVLIPQLLGPAGHSEAATGLLLSALPIGFGIAALGAEAALPGSLGNRGRGALGGIMCAAALGTLAVVPLSAGWVLALLAVTGAGLGIFIPANNAEIMASAPARSAAVVGGLVSMARGLGTTLGIALMTLALHVAGVFTPGAGGETGRRLAFGVLVAAAAASTAIALAGRKRTVTVAAGAEVWPVGSADLVTGGPVGDGPVGDGPVGDGPVADGQVADGQVADGQVADGPVGDSRDHGVDPRGPELADAVSRLRRAMRRAARATDPRAGLSVAQLELLSCLAENPGARPGELARMLRLAPSSEATLAGGLRRAGLITRAGGEQDRRTASLQLTASGEVAVSRWQRLNERLLRTAVAGLPPASRSSLGAALPALRELAGAIDALADEAAGQPPGGPAAAG
jgi:MFS family permease/DNA-binding MarR family transcriptional regulator